MPSPTVPGSDCGCCVVSGSCYNFIGLRQSKFCCYFLVLRFRQRQSSHGAWQHLQGNTADFCHLFDQHLFLDIHQKLCPMHRSSRLRMRRRDGMPGNLWKHDFADFLRSYPASFSFTQRIFGAVKPANAMFAVYSESFSFRLRCSDNQSVLRVRPPFQRIAGRMTLSFLHPG